MSWGLWREDARTGDCMWRADSYDRPVRAFAPITDLLKYWRSRNLSIFSWGWLFGVAFVWPLLAFGWWGAPVVAVQLAVLGYVFQFDEPVRSLLVLLSRR
jgi:hypothetical protein